MNCPTCGSKMEPIRDDRIQTGWKCTNCNSSFEEEIHW